MSSDATRGRKALRGGEKRRRGGKEKTERRRKHSWEVRFFSIDPLLDRVPRSIHLRPPTHRLLFLDVPASYDVRSICEHHSTTLSPVPRLFILPQHFGFAPTNFAAVIYRADSSLYIWEQERVRSWEPTCRLPASLPRLAIRFTIVCRVSLLFDSSRPPLSVFVALRRVPCFA